MIKGMSYITRTYRWSYPLILLSLLVSNELHGQNNGASALLRTAEGRQSVAVNLRAFVASKSAKREYFESTKAQVRNAFGMNAAKTLPLWLFDIQSPRDYRNYTGVAVGTDPSWGGKTSNVTTQIIPVVIVTHSIVTGVDQTSGNLTTTPGVTTFDPTAHDSCIAGHPNVPLALFHQSPIFKSATFDFGGTVVGTTQYNDAIQRGSLWKLLGDEGGDYHVLLSPVKTLGAIVVNVPAAKGLAIPGTFAPNGSCNPIGIVDINWLDSYLQSTVIPLFASVGVRPSTLPIFLYHNVVQSDGVPSDANSSCCILGYHSSVGFPIQTYATVDFESTGFYSVAFQDTVAASHEISEWMNDPFGNNSTPAWGGVGEDEESCQNNLELADPLAGVKAPPIAMSNGFTYHLQEIAFFSWFFGGPSVGVNGWYSSNGTFLTDAGLVCGESDDPSSHLRKTLVTGNDSGWKLTRLTK